MNLSQIGEFCETTPPPLCVQNRLNSSRVCPPGSGSFLSTGSRLTVVEEVGESTAVNRLTFNIQYEFVRLDKNLEGSGCDKQLFSDAIGGNLRSGVDHSISSPSSTFFYGRGGRTNLTCNYLIRGSRYQRIQLNIQNISIGGRACRTVFEAELARYRCDWAGPRAGVYVSEVGGEGGDRAQCYCQYMHGVQIRSAGSGLLLTFLAEDMGRQDDYSNFFLHARFKFIDVNCEDPTVGRGGGLVRLDIGESGLCDASAWSLLQPPSKHVLLSIPGVLLPQPYAGVPKCRRRNRLIVRTVYTMSVICPDPDQGPVQLYSYSRNESSPAQPVSGLQSVQVKLTGPGPAYLSWVEYTPEPAPSALTGSPAALGRPCDHPCPGLGCISPSLWCDGVPDCPGGWDEREHCAPLAPVKLLLGLSIVGVFFFLVTATVLVMRLRSCSHQGRTLAAEPGKKASNGTLETVVNHKDEVS